MTQGNHRMSNMVLQIRPTPARPKSQQIALLSVLFVSEALLQMVLSAPPALKYELQEILLNAFDELAIDLMMSEPSPQAANSQIASFVTANVSVKILYSSKVFKIIDLYFSAISDC
jgi:hypothetical protein